MKKIWIEYKHNYATAEVKGIWRGTEEQLINKFKKDFDDEILTYEELMSHEYQSDMDFTLEEVSEDIIKDL